MHRVTYSLKMKNIFYIAQISYRNILFLSVFFPTALVQAQEVEVVEVTGIRQALPIQQAPYALHKINTQQLQHGAATTLPEALSEVPGVSIQKTANGQGSPFIRGFTGYRTLALIDGVRYNNSVYRDGPSEYFSLIDLQSLENIEVINGSSSVLYGSDAIGGVLSLQSKTSSFQQEQEKFLFVEQSLRFSSGENSWISRTELDIGSGQQWGLHAGLSLKYFGDIESAGLGRQAHTGYDENAFDLRFDTQINEQWLFTALHQQLEQDDVWRTHKTIHALPFAGTSIGGDLRNLKDQQRQLNYVKLVGDNLDGYADKMHFLVSSQNWQEDADRIKGNSQRNIQFFDSRMLGLEAQVTSYNSWGEWVYGLDFYRDKVDSGRQDFNSDGSLNRIRVQGAVGDDAVFDQAGVFLNWSHSLNDNWLLIFGGRYSQVHVNIGTYEDPLTGNAANYNNTWHDISRTLRLSHDLTGTQSHYLWAGYSESFRAPNVADISRYGNSRSSEIEIAATELSPEKFLTYEIGYKNMTNRLTTNLTYYYTDIEDYITSTPTGFMRNGLSEVSKNNSASGYTQGVELSGELTLNSSWIILSMLNWQNGKLVSDPFINSQQALEEPFSRSMPWSGQIGITWVNMRNDLFIKLLWQHTAKASRLSSGDREDTQRIPPNGTPAYDLVALRFNKEISRKLHLNISLENILNEAYRPHGSGTNQPGFGVNFGISFSL